MADFLAIDTDRAAGQLT